MTSFSTGKMARVARLLGKIIAVSSLTTGACLTPLAGTSAHADSDPAVIDFQQTVQPFLNKYCYDCHADGMDKGGIAFDELKSRAELLDRDLWWKVLKNVRAGVMPPAKKAQPTAEEKRPLEQWIKTDVFGADPANPDPGRVTIRRLNRVEYHNTIRDLMGFDFKVEEEFPPDDSGYGFDDIGDVLTVSPLLLEKYMRAAEAIVTAAVPTIARVAPERIIRGADFRGVGDKVDPERMTFYKAAKVAQSFSASQAGNYRVLVDLAVKGAFDFDPGRCRVVFKIEETERLQKELGWQDNKKYHFEYDVKWQPGEHRFELELQPLTPPDQKRTSVDLQIATVTVQGPTEKVYWTAPKNYDRFFTRAEPPKSRAERRQYARETLRRFASKAYRRPVDEATVNRLVAIAEAYNAPAGRRFEEGIAQAMIGVLASPHFLFRVEQTELDPSGGKNPLIDEYSLASRLSYFLWSTMPDEELTRLAAKHELRKNLDAQVRRLLDDPRSEALVQNFTGQWLQARDVEGIAINERRILARESNEDPRPPAPDPTGKRPFRFAPPKVQLTREIRVAMRQETESTFNYVARQDRSVLELLDADYTFLNERLAQYYGITNVTGGLMRRVTLPKDSPRGGVLTEGTVLVVTSNPTRTSPVKRGQFVLDNILGMPAPPPPPDVPPLEATEKKFDNREPTLREILAEHRDKPLCSSCHSRMDPLGLALDNFSALALWRDKELGSSIDATGKLISGESFHDLRDLKRILVERHSTDFYRCLTEKMLTYALGRGLEYYDVQTVDQIVDRLTQNQGRFSALLTGIVESAPFQKRRAAGATTATSLPLESARLVRAQTDSPP